MDLTYNQLLKVRISLIIVKESFTFINTPIEYSNKLYKWFGKAYNEEDIKACLYELEESFIEDKENIREIPEDFKLENIKL